MVKELRKGTDAATAREMNSRLQAIEGEADQLELDLLRELYHGDYDAEADHLSCATSTSCWKR